MDVNPTTARFKTSHNGKEYFFCCAGCLQKFQANPEKILARPRSRWDRDSSSLWVLPRSAKKNIMPARAPISPLANGPGKRHAASMSVRCAPKCARPARAPVPSVEWRSRPESPALRASKTEYTCPMHPEIVRSEPGNCPICGMALEPRTVTAEEANPELRDMTRPLLDQPGPDRPAVGDCHGEHVVATSTHGRRHRRHQRKNHLCKVVELDPPWLELILATPVVLWGGWPFFQRGWASIVNRSTNMFTLIAMGTGVAYVFSVVATLVSANLSGVVPDDGRPARRLLRSRRGDCDAGVAGTSSGTPRPQPDFKRHSRAARSKPEDGARDHDKRRRQKPRRQDQERDIPLEQVKPGDRLRVRPGEKIPVDGIVLDGSSAGRRIHDHGRIRSSRKSAGARVIGATVNGNGSSRHASRARRQRDHAGADRPDGQPGADARAPRFSAWPTKWPDGLFRR